MRRRAPTVAARQRRHLDRRHRACRADDVFACAHVRHTAISTTLDGTDTGDTEDTDTPACADPSTVTARRSASPSLTWNDLPFSNAFYGPDPLVSAIYVPGATSGHFAVAGDCSFSENGAAFEAGGMVLFDDDGAYLDQADVCFDTSIRASGCSRSGGCAAGTVMHVTEADRIVREAHPGFGYPRSPVAYRIVDDAFVLDTLIFFNDFGFTAPAGQLESVSAIAVADGSVWGLAQVAGAASEVRRYDVDSFVDQGGTTVTETPEFGVGPLLAGRVGMSVLVVRDVSAPGLPQVLTIDMGARRYQGIRPDPLDPDRFALLWGQGGPDGPAVQIWHREGTTLELEQELELTAGAFGTVALLGDYLATGDCATDPCTIQITRGGVAIEVDQQLPAESFPGSTNMLEPVALALAPNGVLLVSARALPGEGNGEVWTYQLDDPDPTCRSR